MGSSTTVLSVDKLKTVLKTPAGLQTIVDNVYFDIHEGETFVLLGESGSGKSITALSVLQLLPPQTLYGQESRIVFNGVDLLLLPEYQLRKIRGGQIAMIFQEPMTSLNPVQTIGVQIQEAIQLHQKLTRRKAFDQSLSLLEAVQIQDPKRVARSYPHQLSGGMKQRAMIAMALGSKPRLLIADEPTTALDVTTQSQILKLLKAIQSEYQMAILFITHDLRVAEEMGDRVGVMQAGSLVEQGSLKQVLQSPQHPYTRMLLNAKPQQHKINIPDQAEVVLSVENLNVHFPIKGGLFQRTIDQIAVVENVSFTLQQGETLALVGESGSGKTTLAKALLALIKPSIGQIQWLGEVLNTLSPQQLREKRSDVQIIFQDPFGSMDPRFRVMDIIAEGMRALNTGLNSKECEERVDALLQQVGLEPAHKYRYPHQFSGGQRQRICIARALAVGPRIIVCDEPTSSLDVSVGAQIIDLLIELQKEYEISYLFITHNLSIVKAMAHQVAVMYQGKIVEYGSCDQVLNQPQHAYTQALLAAIPG